MSEIPFDHDHDAALQPFIDEGWITEVLQEIKSGKEATVFACRGGARAPFPLVAAKVHRPIETRRFRNDAVYVNGRVHMAREGRAKRAVQSNTAFGLAVQFGTWLFQEWEILRRLHDEGLPVPAPLAVGERALLMEFIGDAESGAPADGSAHDADPAPMLHRVRPDRALAVRLVDQLLDAIEIMLDIDVVHGDLSPYNVMVRGDDIVIIDFPQATDPRLNDAGRVLLARDIDHVCAWAAKHGVHRPAEKITRRLWSRFMLGELG